MTSAAAPAAGPRVGPYQLPGQVLVAPMAGVTDAPFRALCRTFGAAYTVSEMTASHPELLRSDKTRRRANLHGEPCPRAVQIVGTDPQQMAEAARHNHAIGADIIDINMGCPAKTVARNAAGAALLRDEGLVARILQAVVAAVPVPVTLKMRTGWEPARRNAVRIAQLAEHSGIAALAIHGRTRACRYSSTAEYATIAEVVSRVTIPVFANGDIDSPVKARQVLGDTGAAAVMIGRAAQGNPWLLRDCDAALRTLPPRRPPARREVLEVMRQHVVALHHHYGPHNGLRIARKHASWYGRHLGREWIGLKDIFNRLDAAAAQMELLTTLLENDESDGRYGW